MRTSVYIAFVFLYTLTRMKTRRHRGGNSSRNMFAWQYNNAYNSTNKAYKHSAENNAYNRFWSGANSPAASGNANTYVPRTPRQVPVLYNGVNYNESVPGPKKRTLVNRLFGRKNNTKKVKGFAGTGTATRQLDL